MSLVGNLEDLGLGEILQIVSLSRKSGVLSLESRGRRARVIFRNGQVVRASSTTFPRCMGEVLIRKGVIDPTVLERALEIQADEGHTRLLGCIMIDLFGIGADAIEAVVREQIENVVYSLFVWEDGGFEFELQEVAEWDATSLDPVQFMLRQGLNPQYLAMEGSRITDELRHRESGAEPEQAAGSEESLDLAFNLLRETPAPAAPTSHSRIIGKPPLAPRLPAALPQAAPSGGGPAHDLVNIGDELRLEMGEEPAPCTPHTGQSTGIAHLRGMLEELNDSQLSGGIILLVLRFAAEFLNRAVVLLVKKDVLQGLGQFGLADGDDSADVRVRNLRIPRDQPSFFAPVLETRSPLKGKIELSGWNSFFLDRLGEARPAEVFAGPIVSEGKVVAVLYGDNLPGEKPIGDTDSLEIFLGQAGIAMEKALLQRRLQDHGRGER